MDECETALRQNGGPVLKSESNQSFLVGSSLVLLLVFLWLQMVFNSYSEIYLHQPSLLGKEKQQQQQKKKKKKKKKQQQQNNKKKKTKKKKKKKKKQQLAIVEMTILDRLSFKKYFERKTGCYREVALIEI